MGRRLALLWLAVALVGAATTAVAAPASAAGPNDRAVTTDGDMTGLHVLVADSHDGYHWRTAATLSEPDTATDQWVGQSCVTGSGRYSVVVYAPREFTNDQTMFARGALAAVVNLDTGGVTKLPEPVSLAYYDPGCGAGDSAVLTEELATGTRLTTVDATAGKITSTVDTKVRATSAVPTPSGVVAASGSRLVHIGRQGAVDTLATAADTPFRLAVAADGSVGYEVQRDKTVELHRYAGKDQVVTTAPAQSVRLAGIAGRLYVRGAHAHDLRGLPDGWTGLNVPVDAELSTNGGLAVDSAVNGREATGDTTLGGTPASVLPVHVTETVLATNANHTAEVTPQAPHPELGAAASPAVPKVPGAAPHAITPNDTSTDTTDPDRACAIPRNDPKIESLQPTAEMTEWAADLAVKGKLTVQRPAGYNGSTLPAYTPQGLFSPHLLHGTSNGQVPAQVLLGVMAQESNMWQASPHAADGESGNFEQGGFYGRAGPDTVDFANADCGYGAMQVTTGMRVADGASVYSHDQQVALTVDYAANVAAGLQILQDKWNQTHDLGVIANDGDPSKIENWWFALWAYNTGWHYRNDPSDPHSVPDAEGLGWSNNVRNEDYPADRHLFLDNTTSCTADEKDSNGNCIDAKHPNDWSYPERVIGFASHSLTRYDYQSGTYGPTFPKAHWSDGPQIPLLNQFCSTTVNTCDPASVNPGTASHCQRADFACYWHASSTWITDMSKAGTEVLSYAPGDPEPTAFKTYQSDCSTTELPSDALVIDDQPTLRTQNGCAVRPVQHGSLTFSFGSDSSGHYPSKMDFHQLDTGYGGHFWFAHAWHESGPNDIHEVTGTWTLDRTMTGWARVVVYVPDHGAADPQAFYTVHGSDTTSATRSVVEGNYLDANRKPAPGTWESLGVFHFNGTTPSVSLSNLTKAALGGSFEDGDRDVSWDAVAFEPLAAAPRDQVVVLGDSYTSGEGNSHAPTDGHWDYYRSSDHDGSGADDNLADQDACHRSPFAWSRQASLPDSPSQTIANRIAGYDPSLEYHMSACSGAVTSNLLQGQVGQFDEGAQLDQGYLDQHTTLVMLSIGGNDARFSDIIQQCIEHDPLQDCQNAALGSDTALLKDTEPTVIDQQMGPAVQNVLTKIHALAPNAKIMLMGYPRIVEPIPDSTTHLMCVPGLSVSEATWLYQTGDALDLRLAKSVDDAKAAGVDVTFADPRPAFIGHGVCGDPATGKDPQINNIITTVSRGEDPDILRWGDFGIVSLQSFHPNYAGAQTYAGVATQTLKSMF